MVWLWVVIESLLIVTAAGFAAAAAVAVSGSDLETPHEVFDPWAGIDRDGRIPAAEIPDDLPNPAHWRYIPEGRIKPGNVYERFLVTSFMSPFVFHNSDVGTGGGIALADIDVRLKRRREFLGTFLSYTSEGQQSYTVVWERWMHQRDLPRGGTLIEDRSFWRVRTSYSKTLTRRFFGIGPNSKESDEASYTDKLFWLEWGFERAIPEPGADLIVGLNLRTELHDLADGKVGGSLEVPDLDADLYEDAQHRDLGRILASMRWDTRDSPINPYRGWMVGADIDAAPLQSGGRKGALYRLTSVWIHPLPGLFHDGGDRDEENPPTDTLSLGLRSELTSGDLPFFSRPTLGGGDDLRGYIEGRFRDDASWLARFEYRFWFIPRGFRLPFTDAIRMERVGAAIFYDAGSVADDGTELFDSKVRHSYGFGLRFMIERTAPFRLDLAFSEEGFEFSAGFGFEF